MAFKNAVYSTSRRQSESEALGKLIETYNNPGLALWRATEVSILTAHKFENPALDLGCGDGSVSSVLPVNFEVGIDSRLKVVKVAKRRKAHRSHSL